MAEIVDTLVGHTGLSSDLIQKGLGALLSFLKSELGEPTFAKLESLIPGADEHLSQFQASPAASSSGGLFDLLTTLAGKLLGPHAADAAKLFESLSHLGFNAEQIESFVPKAFSLLKTYVPAELLEEILTKLPALRKLAGVDGA